MEDIKNFIREFRNVFAWLYKNLGNRIPIEVTRYIVFFISEAKSMK